MSNKEFRIPNRTTQEAQQARETHNLQCNGPLTTDIPPLNLLDYFFILVVVIMLLFGMLRGLIRAVFSLFALVAGVYCAFRFYPLAAEHLLPWAHRELIANALSIGLIFIIVTFAISLP